MENKQTAVKFLIEHIKQDTFVHSKSTKEWNQVFAQAKQMEKDQLEKFYLLGDKDGFESCYYHNSNCLDFEQYYNETYGK